MTTARKQRLNEARKWWREQGFDDSFHIIKAYRKRFSVDFLGTYPVDNNYMSINPTI